MKKRTRRKAFVLTVLSLLLCMGLISSYAANLEDDFVNVFNDRTPQFFRGWLMPNTSSSFTKQADNLTSIQSGNSTYKWRLQQRFATTTSVTWSNPQFILGFSYDTTIDFNVNRVYSFELDVRYNNAQGDAINQSIDWSKLYICFARDPSTWQQNSFTLSQASTLLPYKFAPASCTVVPSSGVRLKYNIPIFPVTTFYGWQTTLDSTTGEEYIGIDAIYFWNAGDGAITPADGSDRRFNAVFFPYLDSLAKSYTPEEWQSHIVQDGMDQLSQQIDAQTDAILNAGDTIDLSSLEQAHESEETLVNNITHTLVYRAQAGDSLFTGALGYLNPLGNMDHNPAVTMTVNWLDYMKDNIVWLNYAVGFVLMTSITYMVFKAVM